MEVDVAFADLLAMCVIDLNTIVCHRYWCIFSSIYFIYIEDIEDTLTVRRGFPIELAADVHELHISQRETNGASTFKYPMHPRGVPLSPASASSVQSLPALNINDPNAS